jgi:hypothetical protein
MANQRRRFSLAAMLGAVSFLAVPLALIRAGVIYRNVGLVVIAIGVLGAWFGGIVGYLVAGREGIAAGIFFFFFMVVAGICSGWFLPIVD